MQKISMTIPADFKFVPGVRNCIARTAYNFGFNDREAYQIETIVDEICNNAIEHGSLKKDSVITLECEFHKKKVEITVTDKGQKKFNIEQTFKENMALILRQQNDPKALLRRGRGLIIVKRLADQLNIKAGTKGTVVKIVKKKLD